MTIIVKAALQPFPPPSGVKLTLSLYEVLGAARLRERARARVRVRVCVLARKRAEQSEGLGFSFAPPPSFHPGPFAFFAKRASTRTHAPPPTHTLIRRVQQVQRCVHLEIRHMCCIACYGHSWLSAPA